MKINWKFLGGGGAKEKTFRGGSMDIVWNSIMHLLTKFALYNLLMHSLLINQKLDIFLIM